MLFYIYYIYIIYYLLYYINIILFFSIEGAKLTCLEWGKIRAAILKAMHFSQKIRSVPVSFAMDNCREGKISIQVAEVGGDTGGEIESETR